MEPTLDTVAGVSGGFRGDVQGLRAVAVLTVVAAHAGVPHLPGGFVGVDVFFVISGFLISGLLFSELQRGGALSLTGFWAGRGASCPRRRWSWSRRS